MRPGARAIPLRTGLPGQQVAWQAFGQGRPLVLLHGGHGSWQHWVRNVEALSARRQVWVADMPGFGASDAPAQPTLEGLLHALLAALEGALGRDTRFDLAGFSFGGLVAAHVAARCGRVERLALLGPGGHGSVRRPRGELLQWRQALAERDDVKLRQVMRHNLLLHMLHDEAAADELALQVHTEACLRTRFRSKPISLAGGLQACLDAWAGPLLLAWGEHDVTATPHEAARALGAGRAACETLVVPGSGHWVQYEASALVNESLARFLGAP